VTTRLRSRIDQRLWLTHSFRAIVKSHGARRVSSRSRGAARAALIHVLEEVLRHVPPSGQAQEEAVDARAVLRVHRVERRGFGAPQPGHDLGVGAFHVPPPTRLEPEL
jgi:hypothetical protein